MKQMNLADASSLVEKLRSQIGSVIFGQDSLVTESICCFLSGGHILMTGAPGLAKTTLVRVIAQKLGLSFGRVQFTPDLLPADIIGSEVLNIQQESGKRSFEFVPGPIFVNLVLADEINRASPRTQSAMLEAMQESQVTVGGQVHHLPSPFMVFATQNPFESEGTFPLPEAQLDRFLLHSLVEYPQQDDELKILAEHANNHLIGEGNFVDQGFKLEQDKIASLIQRTQQIHIKPELLQLINELVRSTRPDDELCNRELKPLLWYGAGPRAGISLISVSRAFALLNQEEHVRWRHIKRMAKPVLRHRIRLAGHSHNDELTVDKFIEQIIEDLEQRHSQICEGAEDA